MSIIEGDMEVGEKLASLLGRVESEDVRRGFLWALMTIPKKDGLLLFAETNGKGGCLAIDKDRPGTHKENWCFSLEMWPDHILGYVRANVFNSGEMKRQEVEEIFPHAKKNTSGESTVWLNNFEEIKLFIDLISGEINKK